MTKSFAARAVVASLAVGALLATSAGAYAGAATKPKPKPTLPALTASFDFSLVHPVSSINRVPLITEASDGAVFYVSGERVYRVDNHDSIALAKKVGERVFAVAASSTLLIVETANAVTAYSRSSGKQVASWDVEEHGEVTPDLVIAGNIVWSLTDQATDESGLEPATVNELRVGQLPKTLSIQAAPIGPVIDASGDVFFVSFVGKIVRVSPSGAVRRTTSGNYSAATLAYVDGTLLAEVDEATTTDYELNPATLAVITSGKGHAGDYDGLVGTAIGDLSMSINCGPAAYCKNASVQKINLLDTRAASGAVPFGAAVLGPDPIVVEIPTSGPSKLAGVTS